MQEAPLPVMPVPQVHLDLVKTLEALTGIIENMWNPDAGQPPDHLVHAIQESRANLQTSSAIVSQEGGATAEAELGAEQDPELWDLDEDEAEEMEGFEQAPPVEATRARKAAAERTPRRRKRAPRRHGLWSRVVPSHRRPNGCQRDAESQRHGTFGAITALASS